MGELETPVFSESRAGEVLGNDGSCEWRGCDVAMGRDDDKKVVVFKNGRDT